jgi:hypothetical protein
MAALVVVLVMPLIVKVLMGMHRFFVAMLMAVVAMRNRFVPVLMLMLVLAMAAHGSSLLSYI